MVGIHKFLDDLFPFPNHKHVDKGGKRFWIERSTRATGNHKGIALPSFIFQSRHTTQFQNIQNVKIIHFERYRKTH